MSDERSSKRTDYLDWDEYFMATAYLASLRSKDPNTQVGTCIVNKEKKIVGVGYNGMPTGCDDDVMPWVKEGATPLDNKHLYVCHAEMNAIANRNSADVKDCILYTTLYPCNECAKLIIQSGIREVVYTRKKRPEDPKNQAAEKMLNMVNVIQRRFLPKRNQIIIAFDQ